MTTTSPTLILAGHDAGQLDPSTARLVGAARSLGRAVHVLVLGPAGVAAQAAALDGVAQVLHAEAAALPNAETVARVLAGLLPQHGAVLAAHTLLPRAALPRAAALAGAAFLADVTALLPEGRVVRPMYAGGVLATVQVHGPVLMTLRASAFDAVGDAAAAPVVALPAITADERSRLVGREVATSARPDLTRARVVIAGGRGVGAAEHMQLVEALADRLGGAVGASRAAVDAGFAPNAIQVGQTGKAVAPELYLAAGISGAIQHVAGIKDAKVIVAVNKDPDAPIFSVADIGLVGDLFEVLPALTAALPAR
jgi:electron transfer flavoprotein alpha subunit